MAAQEVHTTTTYESKFCEKCQNLMYIRTQPDGRSTYVCRFDPTHVETDAGQTESSSRHFDKRIVAVVRTYGADAARGAGMETSGSAPDPDARDLLEDPTLPRIQFRCKYAGVCDGDMVVATRVNEQALLFKYVCMTCSRSWLNKAA